MRWLAVAVVILAISIFASVYIAVDVWQDNERADRQQQRREHRY